LDFSPGIADHDDFIHQLTTANIRLLLAIEPAGFRPDIRNSHGHPAGARDAAIILKDAQQLSEECLLF
jgi:hypothetical protein